MGNLIPQDCYVTRKTAQRLSAEAGLHRLYTGFVALDNSMSLSHSYFLSSSVKKKMKFD